MPPGMLRSDVCRHVASRPVLTYNAKKVAGKLVKADNIKKYSGNIGGGGSVAH